MYNYKIGYNIFQQVMSGGSSPDPEPVDSLVLTFDNISNASVMIGADASVVSNWNSFFDLPEYGEPFTSVILSGNDVNLAGGSDIILKESLFGASPAAGSLLLLYDNAGCIVEMEADVFGWNSGDGCEELLITVFPALVTMSGWGYQFNGAMKLDKFVAPLLLNVQAGAFDSCSLTEIDISSCTDLGGTVGDNGVFGGQHGVYSDGEAFDIQITVPTALMTANGGNPDGDLQYLISVYNTTVIQV